MILEILVAFFIVAAWDVCRRYINHRDKSRLDQIQALSSIRIQLEAAEERYKAREDRMADRLPVWEGALKNAIKEFAELIKYSKAQTDTTKHEMLTAGLQGRSRR